MGTSHPMPGMEIDSEALPINVRDLSFQYSMLDSAMVIQNLTLQLERGSRCLLVGSNGAGKTTMLNVLGGKHMHSEVSVQVLGQPAFSNTHPGITVLSGQWAKHNDIKTNDVSVREMIDMSTGIDAARLEELLHILDIQLQWRMHMVSDGQRRRVQIMMALLKPFEVLLLDEVTVDLDVVARSDLLEYLKKECDERGATILYATHIFDGLDEWATHIAQMSFGKLCRVEKLGEVEELTKMFASDSTSPLLDVIDGWLRIERVELLKQRETKAQEKKEKDLKLSSKKNSNDPFFGRNRMYNYW